MFFGKLGGGSQMAEKYTAVCEKCGAEVLVEVTDMGVPGGKEKEEGYCPVCHNLVAKHITSGFVRTYLAKSKDIT